MKRTLGWSFALGFAVLLAACGGEGSGTTTGAPAGPTTAAVTATATATAADSATATATATASAAATDAPAASGTASAAPSGTASAAASGTPAASGTAVAKTFDCGAKGQKACPMQGWMKSVMGSAVASGDGERIAKALNTIASKPVPGMGNWSSIAAAGAAKAAAGDIDGAKQSCKACHSAYQNKYQTQMRDRPW